MNTLKAFAINQASQGKELMVFDWIKAAKLINERNGQEAAAGLSEDWEWTGGLILKDGKPYLDDYTYLSSLWATPEIEIDGETFDCFKYQSETPGWNSDTKWPDEALQILNCQKEAQ